MRVGRRSPSTPFSGTAKSGQKRGIPNRQVASEHFTFASLVGLAQHHTIRFVGCELATGAALYGTSE